VAGSGKIASGTCAANRRLVSQREEGDGGEQGEEGANDTTMHTEVGTRGHGVWGAVQRAEHAHGAGIPLVVGNLLDAVEFYSGNCVIVVVVMHVLLSQ